MHVRCQSEMSLCDCVLSWQGSVSQDRTYHDVQLTVIRTYTFPIVYTSQRMTPLFSDQSRMHIPLSRTG